jgi:small subunit ribosomal protein S16
MLMIRLQRIGRKREPVFRMVVTDKRNGPKSGRFIESLGTYDPRQDDNDVNKERAEHWLSQGAIPSDTVHNFFVTKGIVKGDKRNVLPQKSPVKKEGEEEATDEPAETTSDDAPQEVTAESTETEEKPVEDSSDATDKPAVEENKESVEEVTEAPASDNSSEASKES